MGGHGLEISHGITRVGYCIPVQDLYLVLYGFLSQKHFNEPIINQYEMCTGTHIIIMIIIIQKAERVRMVILRLYTLPRKQVSSPA